MLRFTSLSSTGYIRIACGRDACYLVTENFPHRIHRLANGATTFDDLSTGLGNQNIGGLLIDSSQTLYVTQSNDGVFVRPANAAAFAPVGSPPLTFSSDSRRSLVGDPTRVLYAASVSLGVVALAAGGSQWTTAGTGLDDSNHLASDGTNLFSSRQEVMILPRSEGAWEVAAPGGPVGASELTVDRAGALYAISTGPVFRSGVYRLVPDRSGWIDVTEPLSRDRLDEKSVTNLVFDAANNGYLAVKMNSQVTVMMKLPPNGRTWELIPTDGLPVGTLEFCYGLALDSLGRWVVACDAGVFRSP
jgi:hypothetical protein